MTQWSYAQVNVRGPIPEWHNKSMFKSEWATEPRKFDAVRLVSWEIYIVAPDGSRSDYQLVPGYPNVHGHLNQLGRLGWELVLATTRRHDEPRLDKPDEAIAQQIEQYTLKRPVDPPHAAQ